MASSLTNVLEDMVSVAISDDEIKSKFIEKDFVIRFKHVPWLIRQEIRLCGYHKLRRLKLPGFKGEIDIYLVKCPYHGYVLSYPSGYRDNLYCPYLTGHV